MFQLSESQLVSLLEDISERTQKKTTVKVLFIMILNVSTCMAGDLNDSKREQNYFLIFNTTFWILLRPVLLPPPLPVNQVSTLHIGY